MCRAQGGFASKGNDALMIQYVSLETLMWLLSLLASPLSSGVSMTRNAGDSVMHRWRHPQQRQLLRRLRGPFRSTHHALPWTRQNVLSKYLRCICFYLCNTTEQVIELTSLTKQIDGVISVFPHVLSSEPDLLAVSRRGCGDTPGALVALAALPGETGHAPHQLSLLERK